MFVCSISGILHYCCFCPSASVTLVLSTSRLSCLLSLSCCLSSSRAVRAESKRRRSCRSSSCFLSNSILYRSHTHTDFLVRKECMYRTFRCWCKCDLFLLYRLLLRLTLLELDDLLQVLGGGPLIAAGPKTGHSQHTQGGVFTRHLSLQVVQDVRLVVLLVSYPLPPPPLLSLRPLGDHIPPGGQEKDEGHQKV